MKYSLDSCCGPPKVKRIPAPIKPLTGIDKRNSDDLLEDIEVEFKVAFPTSN